MKILVLPFGDAACASTHYRVIQYLEMLKADGIECDIAAPGSMPAPAIIADYDAVLVQKKLFSTSQVRMLRSRAKRLVFDIDDATWHPHGRKHSWMTRWRTNRRLKTMVRAADLCVIANNYLGDHLRKLGGQTCLVPMSLNEKDWPEPASNTTDAPIKIGWSGAPANLRYLESLEPMLDKALNVHRTASLAIFCGDRPKFKSDLPYTYMPWQKGAERAAVSTFSIGLLPLPMDAFSQGKSPIKALQYMATGIPVVATPAAGALEIGDSHSGVHFASTHEQWLQLLGDLIENAQYRSSQGHAARNAFVNSYTASQVYAKWVKLVIQQ